MADDNPYQSPHSSHAADGTSVGASDMARITRQTILSLILVGVASGMLAHLLDDAEDPLSISTNLMSLVALVVVGRWMYFDSRQFGLQRMTYWYLGILCCALVVLPVYFIRTRGWNAWLPICASFGALFAYSLANAGTLLIIEFLLPT